MRFGNCLDGEVYRKMYKVQFKNSKGKIRFIGQAKTKEKAFKIIDDFLFDKNFKSWYKKVRELDDKTTIVDVGSHTEFFYIIKK